MSAWTYLRRDPGTDREVAFLDLFDPGFQPDAPQVYVAPEACWYARTPLDYAVLRYDGGAALVRDRRLRQGSAEAIRAACVDSWRAHNLSPRDPGGLCRHVRDRAPIHSTSISPHERVHPLETHQPIAWPSERRAFATNTPTSRSKARGTASMALWIRAARRSISFSRPVGRAGSPALPDLGDPPPKPARDNHQRLERCQCGGH
jgi:hypothetical protein